MIVELLMKTALIIGDSHVEPAGSFGPALAKLLQAQGYAVMVAGVGSSNARMWASQNPVCRPDKSRCVDKAQLPHAPDLLVISLGTNDAANAAAGGQSPSAAVADLKRVIAQFSPRQIFWIGPPATNDSVPHYTNAAIANYYVAARASDIDIFDSRPVTAQLVAARLGDGVHLYGQGAQVWAEAVSRAIKSETTQATAVKVAIGLGVAATLAILWRRGVI